MKKTICFGEVMARFSPPGHLRLRQAMPGVMEVTFAGAEANVAAAIAALGGEAVFITALPRNEIAESCMAALRSARIDVTKVLMQESGRMGLYYVETGANQRAGNVVYDREGSTFSGTPEAVYPWQILFSHGDWFHTTGISAGVSEIAAGATVAAVRAAREAGLSVSCDLNYRRKLWRWHRTLAPAELARRTFDQMLPSVDVVMGNAFDVAQAAQVELPESAEVGIAVATDAARALSRRYPKLRWVAITLREGCSSTHHRWGALLLRVEDGAVFAAPMEASRYEPYDIPQIVDRIGTGDAFAGALIFALQSPDLSEPGKAIRFATAASCLAHSIKGDFNFCTRQEVEAVMQGSNGGAVSR
jgi:2-dehydro-3-deoxygluconokinase